MITRVVAVSVALAGIQGCGQSGQRDPPEASTVLQQGGVDIRAACPPAGSFEYFFPLGTFEASEPTEGYVSSTLWYSRQLQAMSESSLSCGKGGNSYRFTWLRSFDHAVTIRIDLDSATHKATLYAIELESDGGYEPGREARRVKRELTKAEFNKLSSDIRKEGLWSLPTKEGGPPGIDGSQWMLEGRDGNKYHIVSRWAPGSGPIYNLGLEFLKLSGWQFDNVY
jgi:hypothetical protein